MNLSGKVILVTGASSGIGKSVCKLAASLGAKVFLFGRDLKRLNETYDSLEGSGHECFSVELTDYKLVESIICSFVEKKIKINGFVHSAGLEMALPFRSSTPSQFQKIFNINVFAGFELARIISKRIIIDQIPASFVFLSSINALKVDAGKVIYCSSKSALLAGVKSLALEFAPKKIRCNTVLPGVVNTEMVAKLFSTISEEAKDVIIGKHPLGIGEADDIANLICFLLSDKAKWITGSEFVIDGGYSC